MCPLFRKHLMRDAYTRKRLMCIHYLNILYFRNALKKKLANMGPFLSNKVFFGTYTKENLSDLKKNHGVLVGL